MYFWKWNDAPYCCLCFSFSSVNYLPNVFFMEFDRAQRNWSDLEVLLCSCLKEKAALGESLHTTNTAASSMAVAAALPNLNIWWATEHPSGACASHVLCSVPSSAQEKLSPHLNLPAKTAVPTTPTSQEARAAAVPPGAAISLPWWMLQPPAVSQRHEQHWTACLQMIHFSTRTRFRYDGDLWSVYWSTVLRLLDFILPFLVSEPLVCRLL